MFETVLFLGFPLSSDYEERLNHLPIAERQQFIRSEVSPYLQQIENEGSLYLGKFLGSCIEWRELESSSFHMLSLLKKLVPNYPYENHPLLLLSLEGVLKP